MLSFTDEQLLNLVNNTIKTKTEFEINDFTGGSIQITSTNNHQLIKYKVSLFFGYTNRNAISKTFSIKEDFVTIWQKAILLKVKSLQITNNGMDYSEINALMNNLDEVEVVSNIVVSKSSTTNRTINRKIDFIPPSLEEIKQYIEEKNINVDANQFFNFFDVANWIDSKGNKVKNWKQKLLTWANYNKPKSETNNTNSAYGGWN